MLNSFSQARGTSRWAKRSGGLEDFMNQIINQVNSLVISGVTASTFFGVNSQTSAVDITLTTMNTLQSITMSATGKFLIFAAANTAFFAGGEMKIYNAGTKAFGVKDSSGTVLIASVEPGELYELECLSAGTAAGTWINKTQISIDMAIMSILMIA